MFKLALIRRSRSIFKLSIAMREHYFTFFHWFVFSFEIFFMAFLPYPRSNHSRHLRIYTETLIGVLPEVRSHALFGPIDEPIRHFYRLVLETQARPLKKALVLTDMKLIRASFRFKLHRCYADTGEKTSPELFLLHNTQFLQPRDGACRNSPRFLTSATVFA